MPVEILRDKTCLLTGATGGLGLEVASRFARDGCNLFLTSRSASRLRTLKQELDSSLDRPIHIEFEPGDLAVLEDVEKIITSARNKMETIDILVNAAGVFPVMPLSGSSAIEFETCFSVNVRAPFLLARAFVPDMVAARWGRIINIGSSSAYQGFKDTAIYCSSKHALLGLSRALHDELKEHNIRVYCISPGSMKTAMGRHVKNQDWNTFIDPQQVADLIAFQISFDKEMVSPEMKLDRMIIR